MNIPITMCHGTSEGDFKPTPMPLDAERFDRYFAMAHKLEFESMTYENLAAWRQGETELPKKPIMFDFKV
jgi:hypothetical protein